MEQRVARGLVLQGSDIHGQYLQEENRQLVPLEANTTTTASRFINKAWFTYKERIFKKVLLLIIMQHSSNFVES